MALELIIVLFSPIRAFDDTHGIVIGIEGVGSHLGECEPPRFTPCEGHLGESPSGGQLHS